MRATTKALAALVGLASLVSMAPPALAGDLRIEVNKSHRELYVYHGDERVASHPVAIGDAGHPTPTGQWAFHRIDWNPDWTPPESEWSEDESYKPPGHPENPMGRVRMVFDMPYTVHGTDATHSLGKAVSHGSIRLANDVIIELAPMLMRHGGAPRSDAWVQETLADPHEMRSVDLPDPIPILVYE